MAQASAQASCLASHGTALVAGDVNLQRAIDAHIDAWLAAVAETLAMREATIALGSVSIASFQAVGNLGPEGARCFATSLNAASSASASMSVCVQASATLSGQ
jgi:hypothetical protein